MIVFGLAVITVLVVINDHFLSDFSETQQQQQRQQTSQKPTNVPIYRKNTSPLEKYLKSFNHRIKHSHNSHLSQHVNLDLKRRHLSRDNFEY